jgi:hypothetical protein
MPLTVTGSPLVAGCRFEWFPGRRGSYTQGSLHPSRGGPLSHNVLTGCTALLVCLREGIALRLSQRRVSRPDRIRASLFSQELFQDLYVWIAGSGSPPEKSLLSCGRYVALGTGRRWKWSSGLVVIFQTVSVETRDTAPVRRSIRGKPAPLGR